MQSPKRVEKMDSFLLLAVVVVALLFVGNRDSGRVGDWGRLGELTAGPAPTEVGDDIRILILVSAALATFRMNGWFIQYFFEHK